ncbi:MAG: translocation/assembly module TamB domain-containing protein [Synechococcaceae cyanobacterium]
MTLLPASGSSPDPPSRPDTVGAKRAASLGSRPPRRPTRALLRGLLVAGGVTGLWLGADHILASLYDQQRPKLEQQLGRLLGHPLRLGPFERLGPAGLEVGPSMLLPTRADRSQVMAEGLRLRFDPLASWQLGGPVLQLDLVEARADLRRDASGSWWRPGKLPAGKPSPLDLTINLVGPARVRLQDNRPGLPVQDLRVGGSLQLRPHRRLLGVQLRVGRRDGPGQAILRAGGRWGPGRGWAQLRVAQWPLASLVPLAGVPVRQALAPDATPAQRRAALDLQGRLNARLDLRLRDGLPLCQGEARLQGLRWQPGPGSQPLSVDELPLRCRERQLELASAPWRFGDWRGQLRGQIGADRRLSLEVQTASPAKAPRLGPLQARLTGRLLADGLGDGRLDLRGPHTSLRLEGQVRRTMRLSGPWSIDAAALAGRQWPSWLTNPNLSGSLALAGSPRAPQLNLSLGQSQQRVLGPWKAQLRWQAGRLEVESFRSRDLQASASLPLALATSGLAIGPLRARLRLDDLPLSRLDPLVGTKLAGRLTAVGDLVGPLNDLRPDLALRLQAPGAGPLRFRETWRGRLHDRDINLRPDQPALPGLLLARLNRRWLPERVDLRRGEGVLRLTGSPQRFRWQAQNLSLQGLSLALGPRAIPRPLDGAFGGAGTLDLQPLSFQGRLRLDKPELLGISAIGLTAEVRYDDRDFQIRGQVPPFGGGLVTMRLLGHWRGPLQADFEARAMSALPFRQVHGAWNLWRGQPAPRRGTAADLGSLAIDTISDSLQDQIRALEEARQKVAARDNTAQRRAREDLARHLQLLLDADLRLKGPSLDHLRADLTARAHVWLTRGDRDLALAQAPLELRLEGPLRNGGGSFGLTGLTFALINLFTPVPEPLRGTLAATGRYRLGGKRPELEVDLDLSDGRLGEQKLALEKGQVSLQGDALKVDMALRAAGAANSVLLAGQIPLDPQQDGLLLRMSSRGDGLWFLVNSRPEAFQWTSGSTDLQLLVRGSLSEPLANGFLRLRDGNCKLLNQPLRGVDGTLLFDFEQLLVQDLRAKVGARGRLRGEGRIGLVRPLGEAPNLKLRLEDVPLDVGRLKAIGAGQVSFGGSLTAPELGGQLSIANGSIDASPAQIQPLATIRGKGQEKGDSNGKGKAAAAVKPATPTNLNSLLEAKWDFKEPLVLLGPTVQSSLSESLAEAVPQAPWISFDRLRLRFGPNLRVVMGRIANFSTAGLITVNGPLDPSLRLSGVMRLLGGRLNLFTTSFSLDPDTPNVAVFTPSLGLVPYLDIALRTRVADSLDLLLPTSSTLGQASITGIDPNAGFSSFSQMKLVQVTVSLSGPADQIAQNLKLRSSPPLPQERLVALIGGNSLAGLTGGAAGAALATAVGQTLLSPLLSSFGDVFGQRVSLAIYPSYVNQAVSSQPAVVQPQVTPTAFTPPQRIQPQRTPPQLVLATEVGFDVTNRIKASVLAAHNRSDIPSQLTLNYKASETFSFETSVDTQGAWGGQLQVFFRF